MRKAKDGYVPGPRIRIAGAAAGPLARLRFAAKDVFDVAGYVTGAGVPDRRHTHTPAERTSEAIALLLDAGADLVGRTVTDELAYSVEGRNPHDGAPPNPAAPGRIAGGSSAGSASVVAAGEVDFALGTDTGGSIRIPAALCGIASLRPSHGAVRSGGTVPLAPGFDTVGWMASDTRVLERVGDVLLPERTRGEPFAKIAVAVDAFAIADPGVARAVRAALAPLEALLGPGEEIRLAEESTEGLARWRETFTTIQAREAWLVHGRWIERVRPILSPAVAARFARGASVSSAAMAEALAYRDRIAGRVDAVLDGGTILALPSAPTVAPPMDSDDEAFAAWRARTLAISCVAPLARAPQASVPAGVALDRDGSGPFPVGLGLVSRRGSDRTLLELLRRAYASPSGA